MKLDDIFLGKGLKETGPAGATVELCLRGKERKIAAGTEIDTLLVVIEEVAAEGGLGTLGADDPVGGVTELARIR